MPTKRDVTRRVAALEGALEAIHGLLDERSRIDEGEEEAGRPAISLRPELGIEPTSASS